MCGCSTNSGVPWRLTSAVQRSASARSSSRSCERRNGFTVDLLSMRLTPRQQRIETLIAQDGTDIEGHVRDELAENPAGDNMVKEKRTGVERERPDHHAVDKLGRAEFDHDTARGEQVGHQHA